MNDEALRELKREMLKEIDSLKREYTSFKRRISVIANIFVPGIGFFLYGRSYVKGIVTLFLFVLYNLFYRYIIMPNLGDTFFYILCYIPAIIIWIASTSMVGDLND